MGPLEQGFAVFITGPSGAGKSTVARLLEKELRARGILVEVLDWDVTRPYLINDLDLGFSRRQGKIRVRRLGFVCQLLSRNGVVAVVPDVAPSRSAREEVRCMCQGRYVEIYVKCHSGELLQRHLLRAWRRTLEGDLPYFIGWTFWYEEPLHAEVIIEADRETPEENTARIIKKLEELGYLR
jgi:adenylylsulfate kinase-like enzyme